MSHVFGSGLQPVEIPATGDSTSATTTPTFSPGMKPTPLVGSWADIGWDKVGEPTSSTVATPAGATKVDAAGADANAKPSGATPLLPSTVSAFEGRSDSPQPREETEEYLSNLLTETAKITDGDDGGAPPQRASTPPPEPKDKGRQKPQGGSTTYGRGGSDGGRGRGSTTASWGQTGAQQRPDGQWGAPQQVQYGYGQANPHQAFGGYPGQPHQHQQFQHQPHHHHHQHHQHVHHQHQQQQPFLQHQQQHGFYGQPPGAQNAAQGSFGYNAGHGATNAANSPERSAPAGGPPPISKFTPPPPPTVSLANELGVPDSETPPAKVGEILFALGRRWVQRLEAWLAAHPKERPSAPCPAAEQYATIETWLEKLNTWYEANFNGRRVSNARQSRGRGGRGGRGGRQPHAASQGVTDEPPSFGTAW